LEKSDDLQTVQVVKRKTGLKKPLQDLNKNKVFLLMLLPGSILLVIFSYLPMLGVLMAFKRMKLYSPSIITNFMESKWMGFKNFEYLFTTSGAWNATKNTVVYNLLFIVLGLVLSVGVAIALNEITYKKLSKLYQTAMLLPYFLSYVVVSYVVYAFLNEQYGIVNRIVLPALGKQPIMWYVENKYWPYILVLLNCWKGIGYSAVVYIAAMAGIDKELYEAASIDGASKWQQIKSITLPQLTPLMTILTILAVGRIFRGDFGLFYFTTINLGNGNLKPAADVLDTYIYDVLQNSGNTGMAAAASLYQSVVGFVLVLFSNFVVSKIDDENSLF
jgi:putative aldouronate transport system permease protein